MDPDKVIDKLLFILTFFIVTFGIYCSFVIYQQSRYHPYDSSYKPYWNGEKWVSDPNGFTCVDFTKETIGFLKKIGIVSYQVVGTNKDNPSIAHSWVGIPFGDTIINFEPQTLKIFDPTTEYTGITVNYGSYK